MRKIKIVCAIWLLVMVDLWLFCWSYRKPVLLFFVCGVVSLCIITRIPMWIVQRLAKQNSKATYEHLFGFWKNVKWRRKKEELLSGPPEMRRDHALMEALRQWIALSPLFIGCSLFVWLGTVLLEILEHTQPLPGGCFTAPASKAFYFENWFSMNISMRRICCYLKR